MHPRRRALLLGGLATAVLPHPVRAQYGAARVVLLVPFPPGGASDALARQLAPHLEATLSRTVVVENLPGASGTLAAQRMLSAPPDGHTLMVVSSSETIMPPLLMPGLRYQAEDFRLLMAPLQAPVALLARPGLPVDTVQELLATPAGAPRLPFTYGSFGHGSVAHLAAEHFAQLTGLSMTHVPYRGGAPLVNELLGDQVDLAFFPMAGPALQLAQQGRLKVLGLASRSRPAHLSRFALLTDQAALQDFVHAAWNSIAVSRGVPLVTAHRLNRLLDEILRRDDVRALAERQGTQVPAPMGLDELDSFYREQVAGTRALARAIKLQALS